jgi:hypothetical protein
MAQDINGREIGSVSESDLLAPTTGSGGGSFDKAEKTIDKLTKLLEERKKQDKKSEKQLDEVIKSVDGLKDELEDLEKGMARIFTQVQRVFKHWSGGGPKAGGGKTVKDMLTGRSFEKTLDKSLKDMNKSTNPDLRAIRQKVESKHTIYVRDTELFKVSLGMLEKLEGLSKAVEKIGNRKRGGSGGGGTGGGGGGPDMDDIGQEVAIAKKDYKGIANSLDASTEAATAFNSALDAVKKNTGRIVDLNTRLLRNLRHGVNPIKDQLGLFLQSKKARQEDFNILRETEFYSHKYTKTQKDRLDVLSKAVLDAGNNEQMRNEAVKDYLSYLDVANTEASKTIGIWGDVRGTIKDTAKALGKMAIISVTTQVSSVAKLGEAWGSPISAGLEYGKNLNELGYTLGENLDTMKQYAMTERIAQRTGQSLEKFEKHSLQIAQKGYKDKTLVNKVTEQSLKLATDIGVSTEETSELLGNWVQKYKLSANEAAILGRSMKEVAVSTGLTGTELTTAIKAAEQITNQMRLFGNYTQEAAEGAMKLSAEAQKRGVGEFANQILAASQNLDTFGKASKDVQIFLTKYAISKNGEPWGGLNTDVEKAAAAKRGKADVSQAFANFGIKSTGNATKDAKGLDPDTLTALSRSMGMTEHGFIELCKTLDSLEDAGKPLTQQLGELDDKINDTTGKFSAAEKLAAKQQKDTLQFNAGQKAAQSIAEIMEDETDPEKLAKAIMEANKEGKLDQAVAGMKTDDPLRKQIGNILNQAKSGGVTADRGQLLNTMEASDKKRSEDEMKNRSQGNILTAMQQKMLETSQGAQQLMAEQTEKILTSLGPTGAIALLLAMNGPVASILGNLGMKLLPKLFSKGMDIAGFGTKAAGVLEAGEAAAGTGEAVLGVAGVGEAALGVGETAVGVAGAGEAAVGAAGAGGLAATEGGLAASGIGLPIAAALAIAAGAVGGFVQSLSSIDTATQVFGKTADQLTFTEKTAAEGANFFTGFLNTLTFGLFSGALGPTGGLTKALTSLFDWFPPLGIAISALLIPFKLLWGVIKGLYLFVKETFIGIWEGIKMAFEPFVELWTELKKAFSPIIEAFSSLNSAGGELPSVIDVVSGALGYLGTGLGYVAKAIGFVAKIIITGFIKPIIWLGQVIAAVLTPVVKYTIGLFTDLGTCLSGIWNIIKGIFTLDGKMLWDGIKQAFSGIGKFLWDGFVGALIGIPMWLGGKLMEGLQAVFITFPTWLGQKFMDGLQAVFVEFPKWLFGKICEALKGLVDWVKSMIPGYKTIEKAAGNFSAGFSGDKDALTKSQWGASRGAGEVAGGLTDVVTGGKEGGLTGRAKGLGTAAWGLGEGAVGLGAAALGRGWLWGKGGDQQGSGDSKIAQEADKSTVEMASQATTPGSIYVHDTHLEKLLMGMSPGSTVSGGGSMLGTMANLATGGLSSLLMKAFGIGSNTTATVPEPPAAQPTPATSGAGGLAGMNSGGSMLGTMANLATGGLSGVAMKALGLGSSTAGGTDEKENDQGIWSKTLDFITTSGFLGSVASAIPLIMGKTKIPGEVLDKNQSATPAIPKVPGMEGGEDAVEARLRAERASAIGPGTSAGGNVANDKVSAKQLACLESISQQLSEFLKMMNMSAPTPNQTDPTVEPGDPRAKRNPRGTTNYFSWNQSQYMNKPMNGVSESQPV